MVKFKNVVIPRAFSESDLQKKENFNEPQGMVEIDLENVIFNKFQTGTIGCFLLTLVILKYASAVPSNISKIYNDTTADLMLSKLEASYNNFTNILKIMYRNKRNATESTSFLALNESNVSQHEDTNNTNDFKNETSTSTELSDFAEVNVQEEIGEKAQKSKELNNTTVNSKSRDVSYNNTLSICPTFSTPLGKTILLQPALPHIYISRPDSAHIQNGQHSSSFLNPLLHPKISKIVCQPLPNLINNDTTNSTDFDDSILQRFVVPRSTRCPYGEIGCKDDSKCVKTHQQCDGEVHCKDLSDEAFCPCSTRILKSRICDGYIDCPKGEDELKCFGCELDMFSCDDWSPRERVSTCIPIEQRCDGVAQCPSEKDESDCALLLETLSTIQRIMDSRSVGFLFKNVKGHWYPACQNPERWANEACWSETGPNTIAPLTHLVPIPFVYQGKFASLTKNGINIVDFCENNAAIFVECPPLLCGIRLKERNLFRGEEVDTSAEEIVRHTQELPDINHNMSDAILGSGRVVGGIPSQPKAWPWIVSVYRNGVFHCGGALINEFWIVTAAHCVDRYWRYYFEIQAGVLRRYSYAPMVQNRVVSNIVSHQFYDKKKLKNDIALMKVSNPVDFSRYVRPICLPSEITAGKNFMWGPEPGTVCTAVGWGATVEHGSDPDHLREVKVPVYKTCKHREDEEGKEICAGLREGGKDACQGDSGGPFMCRNPNIPNQWYLAGIVSHGDGCARPNEPGVYTRVSLFLDWIFEHIKAEILPLRRPLHHCPGYTCKKNKLCLPNKRRCDKIIDCLDGDDEIDCDRSSFHRTFKNAMHKVFTRRDGVNDDSAVDKNENTLIESITKNGSELAAQKLPFQKVKNFTLDLNIDSSKKKATNEKSIEQLITPILSFSKKTTEATPNGIPSTVKFSKSNTNTLKFKCKTLLQFIDLSKRCDRKSDCEDATDEANCTCVEYLKFNYPTTICDGETDCVDASDEENCVACKDDEFHCRKSQICVNKRKRCNDVPDCPLWEDEMDCFAFTDGKTLKFDHNFRPYIRESGIVAINHNGDWQIFCQTSAHSRARIAADICFYFGFNNYNNFYEMPVNNDALAIEYSPKLFDNKSISSDINVEQCSGLFVKCLSNVDIKHHLHEMEFTPSLDVATPWNAEIYIEGVYKCTGTLLKPNLIVTSSYCFGEHFDLHSQYVTVMLGNTKSYLKVIRPQEQVLRVVNLLLVNYASIAILVLEEDANLTRYVRPLNFDEKNYERKSEICLAQGRNTNLVYLKLVSNYTSGFRNFKVDKVFVKGCEEKSEKEAWSGCIVCRSFHGWYPSAVYHEPLGGCSFGQNLYYTSVLDWKMSILQVINQHHINVRAPPCDGLRCTLGECISKNNLCDGIPHCRDNADEAVSFCTNFKKTCIKDASCNCLKSELKCKNGNCVPKTAFCDKHNDCRDWSDEPDMCNCREYLSLTQPYKACDGIRNCLDRSDEDPNFCNCSISSFTCEQSKKCVSQEVVCDGVKDCPNGEDESECIAMVYFKASIFKEVLVRTAGLWHSGCFPKELTTLELEEICTYIGFTGKSAKRYVPDANVTKSSAQLVFDTFNGIWLRPTKDTKFLLAIRDGTKSFVTLQANNSCNRLFLNCL
ncbi:hypothetical protein FQA39_LY04222 [Lamprigera yunnana]|nr:hypothetical protein FQA39_LY04222 [Lamprigera yunnana]